MSPRPWVAWMAAGHHRRSRGRRPATNASSTAQECDEAPMPSIVIATPPRVSIQLDMLTTVMGPVGSGTLDRARPARWTIQTAVTTPHSALMLLD